MSRRASSTHGTPSATGGPSRPVRPVRQIQGPQSALTDFLASHNIDANRIRLDADARRAAATASRLAADSNDGDSGPSSPAAEPDIPPPRTRKAETKAQHNKRKKEEEKAIAKIKASKQFQRRRRGYDPDDLTDEDEAARTIFQDSMAPLPGQMENCENCDTRFTVTAYSRAGPAGGLLCPKCSRDMDKEEGGIKKKRKMIDRTNRRKKQSEILDGKYQVGAKNLMTLCIETLSKNVHLAEDLGDLPQSVITGIVSLLSKNRFVDSNTVNLFLKPGSETVTIFEGAKLNSDDFIRIFQTVPSLKHLRLRNSIQFKNNVMDYLIGCTVTLESFSIHGANLIDDERWNTYLIEKGQHLRSLKVYYTDGHFGNETLEVLKIACPDLVRLKLSHNQKITDEGLKHIANLPKLQHLSLQLYSETTSEPYVEIINSIGPGLRTLALTNMHYLDDSVLQAIHENCSKLTKLRLTDNEVYSDNGFVELFTNWSNPPLRYIDLNECRHIDATIPRDNSGEIGLCSAGFQALMKHSGSQVEYLDIKACRHIASEAFESIFSGANEYPLLKMLDVSFCWGVNDFVVGCIFRSCPNLRALKVFGNFGVKDVRVPKGKALIGMPDAMGMQIEGTDD